MESPVCTPTGSMFSMEHTATALPRLSRMTSNSISFHPEMQLLHQNLGNGRQAQAVFGNLRAVLRAVLADTAAAAAQGVGRAHNDRIADFLRKGQRVVDIRPPPRLGIQGWPMASMVSLKFCRSSALSMVSQVAPRSLTPWASRKPSLASCMDRVRPFWPPRVDSRLSGFSFRMMRWMVSRVSGSM